MLVRKFDLSAFEPMGECRYQSLYPWPGVAAPPFGSGWTHLQPGERTKKHQHHEFETYFIARGHGEMRVNEERLPVGPGDVLFMPPFNDHVLVNTSQKDVLFLAVFWEDMKALQGLDGESTAHAERRALVTATSDAARQAAEIHARYLEMRGIEVRRAFGDPPAPTDREAQALAERLLAAGHLVVRAEPAPHLAFPVAPFWPALREHYLSAHLGPQVRAVAERFLVEGLPEIAVSSPGTPGVPAPGLPGQVLTPGFVSFAALLAAGDGLWTADDAVTVQFLSPGEIAHFAVAVPALLLAAQPGVRLPAALVVSGPADPADPASTGTGGSPWSAAEVKDWSRWLAELAGRVAAERGGQVPSTGFYTAEQRRFYKRLLQCGREAAEAYEAQSFAPEEIGRLAAELVWATRRFAEGELAWIGVPDRDSERRTSLALELLAAKVLAMIVAPLEPALASGLARALGAATPPRWEDIPDWVPPGFQLDNLAGALAAAAPAELMETAR